MTNGGDAAEQVVRLSLEGFEVAARLTGSAAKNVAILLASVLKQEATQANKTRGKARIVNSSTSNTSTQVISDRRNGRLCLNYQSRNCLRNIQMK